MSTLFTPTLDGLETHPRAPGEMIVYLIHLERPVGTDAHQALHYTGMTNDLARRLHEHRSSPQGSALLREANRLGIPWKVVGWWPGGHDQELEAKSAHDGARVCPVCHVPSGKLLKPRDGKPAWKKR